MDPEKADEQRLAGYVEVWWQAVGDLVDVLEAVPEEQWTTPTDLPGWDVKACAAHTAHLEGVLAGRPEETADIGEPPHVTGLMGLYTEIGVVNRRDTTKADLLAELREVTALRHEQLLADPPTDGSAQPTTIFGGVPWTWETLLRNRPLDVWMHAQDVRRAVGRSDGLDCLAARHTIDYLAEGQGYVLAKKAGAPAGSTLVVEIGDLAPYAFRVNDAGRGERLTDVPDDPTVRLRLTPGAFVVLAGGRRAPAEHEVVIEGDTALGQRVVGVMATTP